MSEPARRAPRRHTCENCPLLQEGIFRSFSRDELDFVSRFKKGELSVDKGGTILAEGTQNPHLYTVLKGWGFRYKMLPDGRRQIVNYVMPGDLVGLQGSLMGQMEHSVEALSPMVLCVFERGHLMELYKKHPDLAFDLTWIASREECMLDENLLSVGRRTAVERIAYLIAFITARAQAVGLFNGSPPLIPITQQYVADTLGLSLVHTNKTIAKLAVQNLLRWRDGGCEVLDFERLKTIAQWEDNTEKKRPYI